jgi:hypothetical protein
LGPPNLAEAAPLRMTFQYIRFLKTGNRGQTSITSNQA